ncbi:MAG: DNA replication and repair protein RecF [Candidatus Shapirobacteria bacterium]|nr:DNA replication and repair protein RecF [Candidatus Shapirobacteria bacterium]MDD4410085.1 DNA replication and repair protein RecF [Candidatus Shapirobacteria bacterium]
MYLSKLLLQNFRSHTQQLLEFDPKLNLIIGPNGSGKTNILEAISLLAAGKSFRASSQAKLINWDNFFTSVRAKVINDKKETNEIEIKLIKDRTGKSSSVSRKFLIAKVEKTRKKYIGIFKTVIFHPDDIRLVAGSPSRRRDFLDEIFLQTEWRYAQALSQYHKALKHRNELLNQIRDGKSQKSELFYWDQVLIKNAKIISDFRFSFFHSANLFFSGHTDDQIRLIFLNYHPSVLNEDRLERSYNLDLHRGCTQIGIHRDDFSFNNNTFLTEDKNLAFWGSRGQQRLAVLAIRLAQINYLEKIYQDQPVLLLDDIFSELDPDHQKLVVSLCQNYQTVFTAAEPESVKILSTAKIIQI